MLTISLVTYNTSMTDISRLVTESLKILNLLKFYIIDNSPSKSELKFEDDKVTYIFTGKNLGYGAGHNVAIRDAIKIGSEFHVVINPDIYFDFQDLERMIQHMIENPLIGHLMPRITNQEGELQYMCKTLPTPVDLFHRSFYKTLIS